MRRSSMVCSCVFRISIDRSVTLTVSCECVGGEGGGGIVLVCVCACVYMCVCVCVRMHVAYIKTQNPSMNRQKGADTHTNSEINECVQQILD